MLLTLRDIFIRPLSPERLLARVRSRLVLRRRGEGVRTVVVLELLAVDDMNGGLQVDSSKSWDHPPDILSGSVIFLVPLGSEPVRPFAVASAPPSSM